MSVVQNVLIGRTRKSVGNATFTTWKGINVLKSKPVTVENPNTIFQQVHRIALLQLVSLYRKIAGAVTVGMKEEAVHKSEYNAFMSYNLKNAVDYSTPPTPTIQAGLLLFTKGTIAKQPITSGTSSGAIDSIVLNWDSTVLQPGQSATDKAIIIAQNSNTAKWAAFITNVNRSANTATVTFPYDITAADVLDCYLGFYNPASQKAGDNDYISVIAGA